MGGFFTNTRKPEAWVGADGRHDEWGHAPVARWGRSFLRLKPGAAIRGPCCGGGANLAVLREACVQDGYSRGSGLLLRSA